MHLAMIPLLFLAFDQSKAIKVVPGDPVIDLEIQTLHGHTLKLDQVLETSFCFFLSPKCERCDEALTNIKDQFSQRFHTVVVLIGSMEEAHRYVASQSIDENKIDIYVVSQDKLLPYNLRIVPAILCYTNAKLTFGFHGPVTQERSQKIINWYARRYGG